MWERCLQRLQADLPEKTFITWIRPLQPVVSDDLLKLMAPNEFVLEKVRGHLYDRIRETVKSLSNGRAVDLCLEVGTIHSPASTNKQKEQTATGRSPDGRALRRPYDTGLVSRLEQDYTFTNFVEGKSNQLARAAALQVAENPGTAYNPLFLYGGVGLGKTHLMHAVGNDLIAKDPEKRVAYVHSERFVSDMVKAFQKNKIDDFKRLYRSVDALLIDDIQFFANKERSQEEFFHTFNSLLEGKNQVIITCDRFPKEVGGLEERLKSRFGWGLTVSIDPPELETCVAILMSKAEKWYGQIPEEVAFFIAKRIRSNIRELEGSLRTVIALARFKNLPVTLELTKEALRDRLAVYEKTVSIENIQKTVADYCKIRYSDLLSKKRSRAIARPRQIAMSLSKELTNHSLPEIGRQFGGRDHTTVLHASRKIKELRESDSKIQEDYNNLLRILSG